MVTIIDLDQDWEVKVVLLFLNSHKIMLLNVRGKVQILIHFIYECMY